MTEIHKKIDLYAKKGGKNQHFNEIQLELIFLLNFNQTVKKDLDIKLESIYKKAIIEPKY